MTNENFDIMTAFIADIEKKIAALQAVLVSLKSASAIGALGAAVEGIGELSSSSNSDLSQPIDLPEGAFLGKSVPACIELYLSAVKKKKTNKEIVDALREGGVESNSKLDNTVNGALFKLKGDGVVLRFKDGWGLSSWYPAHIRAVSPAASTKKVKKKGKKKEPKNASPKPTTDASAPPKRKAGDVIVEILRAKPEREYSLEEIAKRAELGVNFTRLTLGKLVRANRARMTAPGTYAIGRPQLVAAGD